MSLLNVKAGDWVKIQITEVDRTPNATYPIKFGNVADFTMDGRYLFNSDPCIFPLEPTERWMMVSNDEEEWHKRKVFAKKGDMFVACLYPEKMTIGIDLVVNWKFAKEIEEVRPLEVTLEEIAEKFGVNVNQIKIKK